MFDQYTHQIIVQFRVSEGIGTIYELTWRHLTEDSLGGILETLQMGYCDGGQSGAGTMELFFFVADVARGVELLTDLLTDMEYIGFCKIVSVAQDDWIVHYPAGAKFSMWSFDVEE